MTKYRPTDRATARPAALQPGVRLHRTTRRIKADRGVAKTVLSCTLTLWVLSVVVGVLLHKDLKREDLRLLKQDLPLASFDTVLRQYGAFLPFVGFIIRWWGTALARAKGPGARSPTHFAEAFCIYVGLTAARFIVYGLHVTGILHWLGKPLIWASHLEDEKGQLMSDHLVLGASITAILSTEVVLTLIDLRRHLRLRSGDTFRLACLSTALTVSAALCVATTGDMFFTARYFHGRMETFGGVVLGWLLFQGPLAYWLLSGL